MISYYFLLLLGVAQHTSLKKYFVPSNMWSWRWFFPPFQSESTVCCLVSLNDWQLWSRDPCAKLILSLDEPRKTSTWSIFRIGNHRKPVNPGSTGSGAKVETKKYKSGWWQVFSQNFSHLLPPQLLDTKTRCWCLLCCSCRPVFPPVEVPSIPGS